MATTSIEWTDSTWNPTSGCTKISSGCKNCYAERMTKRLTLMGSAKYRDGFKVRTHPSTLDEPYTWSKPRTVFVNSMSDLFHEDVPLEFIQRVFRVMNDNPQHTFQVLTKRSELLRKYSTELNWTENIWMGVSVEDEIVISRIDHLRTVPASIKFLSIEPLIGRISNINLSLIDWVIVGGESGPGARPIKEEWVTEIRDQCLIHGVPFFFKQWGGTNKKKAGRLLDGRIWDQMPALQTQV